MKVTIESTPKIVEINGVPARIWEGTSERGTPVIALITRVAVDTDAGEQAHAEFVADLQEHAPPSVDAQAWPARMLIEPAGSGAECSGDVFAEDLVDRLDGTP